VEPSSPDTFPILKKDLLKRRFDEEVAEPWVQCNTCNQWVHQICALFNDRYNSTIISNADSKEYQYECPLCKLQPVYASYNNIIKTSNKKDSASLVKKEKVLSTIKNDNSQFSNPLLLSVSNTATANMSSVSTFLAVETNQDYKKRKGRKKKLNDENSESNNQCPPPNLYPSSLSSLHGYTDNNQFLDVSSSPKSPMLSSGFNQLLPPLPPPPTMTYHTSVNSLQINAHATDTDCESDSGGSNHTNVNNASDNSILENNLNVISNQLHLPSSTSMLSNIPLLSPTNQYVDPLLKLRSGFQITGQITGSSDTSVDTTGDDSIIAPCHSTDTVMLDIDHNGCIEELNSGINAMNPNTKTCYDEKDIDLGTQKAKNLPKSKLSNFIEQMINDRLESLGYGHIVDSLTIRVVSNMSHCMEVPNIIVNNFKTNDNHCVPKYITYKSKCILLFQNIEGCDICLFSLYVQEFDDACPQPNKSRINISYIDSVEYFRPREMRTIVFHEILVSYLKWCQARGFQHGYIWACPPQRGDSFIFWCHPAHQRTPSRERLVQWYTAMLNRAISLDICEENLSTLYQTFFSKYCKREDTQVRTASKNSYVSKYHSNDKNTKYVSGVSSDSNKFKSSGANNNGLISESDLALIPVCPPVFEGDMWVIDFVNRVYRLIQLRSKSNEGLDRNINQRKCREIVKLFMSKPSAYAFLVPVDPVLLNIPDYFDVVKHPMDLGTIKEKLRQCSYSNMQEFANDMILTFDNAMLYNPPLHPIHTIAQTLKNEFIDMMCELINERNSCLFAPPVVDRTNINTWLFQYPLSTLCTTKKKSQSDSQVHSVISNNYPLSTVAGPSCDDSTANDITSNKRLKISNVECVDTAVSGSPDKSFSEINEVPRSVVTFNENNIFLSSSGVNGDYDNNNCINDNTEVETDNNSEYMDIDHSDNNLNGNVSVHNLENNEDNDENMFESLRTSISRHNSVESACSMEEWTGRPNISTSVRITAAVAAGTIGNSVEHKASNIAYIDTSKKSNLSAYEERLRNINNAPMLPFDTVPEYGVKGSCAMMAEISRNVMRLKDDMFVINFNQPNIKTDNDNNNRDITDDNDDLHRFSDGKKDGNMAVSVNNNKIAHGKGKGFTISHESSSMSNNNINKCTLSDKCMKLLQDLVPDTSDPDECIMNSFIDSRQTFLEMCQFRHYQFDSLRRAKHSSMMVLYHLFHPHAKSTRIICVKCNKFITETRYHCDQCSDYDICGRCALSCTSHFAPVATNPNSQTSAMAVDGDIDYGVLPHPHPLTPVRVSFV
jgi:hypothetical protein